MKDLIKYLVLLLIIINTNACNAPDVITGATQDVQSVLAFPDLSPEHSTGSTSYLPGATKPVVIRIRNFGGSVNTAPIVFDVTRMDPVFTLNFNPLDTVSTPAFTTFNLDNADWDLVVQGTRYRFTSKPGVVINPGTTAFIGVTLTAGVNGNAKLNTRVVSGTGGGETPTTNNLKITQLSISN